MEKSVITQETVHNRMEIQEVAEGRWRAVQGGCGGKFEGPGAGGEPETALRKNAAAAAKSLQSCPTLCDPIDGSPPGSPVPGILQERTLEWVAISFSNA